MVKARIRQEEAQDVTSVNSGPQMDDNEVACIRQIELLTDVNLDLKEIKGVDLDHCRRFVHTPKDGYQPPEDQQFYLKHYAENQFIQSFMRNVDNQQKKWVEGQPVKVQKVFNNEFSKFLMETSPMRTARKHFFDLKREERRKKSMGLSSPRNQMDSDSVIPPVKHWLFLAPKDDSHSPRHQQMLAERKLAQKEQRRESAARHSRAVCVTDLDKLKRRKEARAAE